MLRWLGWLAQTLVRNRQDDFYIDRVDARWAFGIRLGRLIQHTCTAIVGAVTGLAVAAALIVSGVSVTAAHTCAVFGGLFAGIGMTAATVPPNGCA